MMIPLIAISLLAQDAESAQEKVHFETDVLPILAAHCYRCHGPRKQEADLQFHLKQSILAEDYMIKPGDAEDSELYFRISLPRDDGDAMPPPPEIDPDGGEGLKPEQLDIIKRWIDEGADFGDWTQDDSVIDTLPLVDPAPDDAVEALEKAGAKVQTLALNTNLLFIDFSAKGPAVTDKELQLLSPVREQTAWLKLGGTAVTDAGLDNIVPLNNLRYLDLRRTAVTDAGMSRVAKLSELRRLVLNETKITDAGLEILRSLQKLNKLYVWKTGVTDEAIKKLKDQNPLLQVVSELK